VIDLVKAEVSSLVAGAGSVIDKAGMAHPVLGYLLIEPAGSRLVNIRAAGQAAHAVWSLDAGDLAAPLAIQHAHLAKLHNLMPVGTTLRIESDGSTIAVALRRSGTVIGTWTVPAASASTLAYFPPEPTPEPGGDPETFVSEALADALAQVAWLTTDDSTVQIIDGATVLASSWSAAHRVVMPHRPPYSAVTIVPGRAARVLRTTLPKDRGATVTWLTDEHFHHLTYRGARLHLAKWSGAVENVRARFFPPTNSPDVTVSAARLAGCVARASALSDSVDLATTGSGVVPPEGPPLRPGDRADRPNRAIGMGLTVSASDGSSTQTTDATIPGAGWRAPVRFQATQLASALDAFNGEHIHIESAGTGTVIFSEPDGTQAVSLVPLASVVL